MEVICKLVELKKFVNRGFLIGPICPIYGYGVLAIVLIIVALAVGLIGGFYGARAYMKKYFQENPPINEDMIVSMMSQMGQKPSAKKVNQVMNRMKHQNK